MTMPGPGSAQRMAGIFIDPRVRQFHDPNGLVGDAFAKGLLDQPPAYGSPGEIETSRSGDP